MFLSGTQSICKIWALYSGHNFGFLDTASLVFVDTFQAVPILILQNVSLKGALLLLYFYQKLKNNPKYRRFGMRYPGD